jgi:hypothetical protein
MQKGVENGKEQDARVLPESKTRGCDVIKADITLLTNLLLLKKGENQESEKINMHNVVRRD